MKYIVKLKCSKCGSYKIRFNKLIHGYECTCCGYRNKQSQLK